MRGIEVQITIPGRERRLLLPTADALVRIDWWRQTAAVDQTVAEEAERLLAAIGGLSDEMRMGGHGAGRAGHSSGSRALWVLRGQKKNRGNLRARPRQRQNKSHGGV